MTKSALQQIEELRKDTETKIEALKKQAVEELQEKLEVAEAEVQRIRNELAALGCKPVGIQWETFKRGMRLPKLVEGSEEWNKIAAQVKTVLKNYPEGLNGKTIAYKMGKTDLKDIRRIITVVQATCGREGAGVQTKFFLK